jgi:hypothetical protein
MERGPNHGAVPGPHAVEQLVNDDHDLLFSCLGLQRGGAGGQRSHEHQYFHQVILFPTWVVINW